MSRPAARAAALLLSGAVACAGPAPRAEGPPVVVASIHPVADLAAWVAGDALRVETLLPPRASIHTWEATPAQIRALSRAAGYVSVGAGLDGWLDGLAADRAGLAHLRLTDGLELHGTAHEHGARDAHTGDPHVWLDPILVRDVLVPRLTGFLVRLAPERESELRRRADALVDSLTALDGEIRRTLDALPRRGFIATHDAWSYFAERYDLTTLGTLYESPGHEPSARGLARLVDAARAEGTTAVLSEPQLAETAALALAGEIDAGVVVVDPLGGAGVEGRESYFDLMRFNARAFARALGTP